jgi:hypothetical protein
MRPNYFLSPLAPAWRSGTALLHRTFHSLGIDYHTTEDSKIFTNLIQDDSKRQFTNLIQGDSKRQYSTEGGYWIDYLEQRIFQD